MSLLFSFRSLLVTLESSVRHYGTYTTSLHSFGSWNICQGPAWLMDQPQQAVSWFGTASMAHPHIYISNCRVYHYSFWFVLLTRHRLPQKAALSPNVKIQIFLAPNAQSKYYKNRRTSHLENGSPRTRARFSDNQSTVLLEPEHILREPEHGSPRTRARFSKNQSTVLREPEHGSPRTRAQFSKNRSTVLWESERT